jgi:hypothetical protein
MATLERNPKSAGDYSSLDNVICRVLKKSAGKAAGEANTAAGVPLFHPLATSAPRRTPSVAYVEDVDEPRMQQSDVFSRMQGGIL